MQTVAAHPSAARVVVSRRAPVGRLTVVCNVSKVQQTVKKVAAAAVTLPAFLAAHPAFALVDQRMNGDGTGRSLGINDDQLIYAMTGIFGLVWFLWYSSQKDLGNDADTGSL